MCAPRAASERAFTRSGKRMPAGHSHDGREDAAEGRKDGRGAERRRLAGQGRKPSKIIWSAWRAATARSSGVRTVQVSTGRPVARRASETAVAGSSFT